MANPNSSVKPDSAPLAGLPGAARFILGLLLVLMPLLFGAAYVWTQGLLIVGVLAAFWLASRRPFTGPAPGEGRAWGLWCLLGLVAWAGVQLIPWPAGLVRLVAAPLHQLWQQDFLGAAGAPRSLLPLTIYPYATASQGLLWLAYTLALILARAWTAAPEPGDASSRALFQVIVFTGLAVAAVGITQKGMDAKGIYGFLRPVQTRFFTGPYVNYNHFAGYLEMAIALGLGLIAYVLHTRRFYPMATGSLWLCGGAVIIMAAALFMSRSRGGIFTFAVVTLAQMLVMGSLLSQGRQKRRVVLFGLIVLALLGAGAYMTDWSQTLPRFHKLFHADHSGGIRWPLYKNVLAMSNRLPLTGCGLGAFAQGFAPFKTLPQQGTFRHAHSDYLEMLAETGWPGLLMFLGFVAWVLARGGAALARALAQRRNGDPKVTGRALLLTGALGGVVSLLIHGMVDFNLRIPANAFTWFVLCGLVVGLARPQSSAAAQEPPSEEA